MKKLMFYMITAFALFVSAPMAMAMPVYSGIADTAVSQSVDSYGSAMAVDPTDTKTQSTDNDIFASMDSYRVPGGGNSSIISRQSSDSKVTRNVNASHEGPGYAGVVAAYAAA